MKQTAWAPANIAFIKYWGKADDELRLPLNDSFSMNLSGAFTITTVEFSVSYTQDAVELQDGEFSRGEIDRVIEALDRIRKKAHTNLKARVITKNTFPKGAGSAASASGFAALTVAAFAALGVSLSQKELTILARMGSGSACRSIPDGFVMWRGGSVSENSYAYSLYPHTYWDLCDVLAVVDSRMKKISTTTGMETVTTSPHLNDRLAAISGRMDKLIQAFKEKNFTTFGTILEEECLDMHTVMQTQVPPLMYWNDATRLIMSEVLLWRKSGLPVYFTIDAGPNVHILCQKENESEVVARVKKLSGVERVICNDPAPGAHLVDEHLF